ncbi:MAG TPA: HD-GYP domain-containing protein [Vicinamibacterales bacterium]|nr:HD-GYP domain-containing protein [Vicinamibacterales bacterium]
MTPSWVPENLRVKELQGELLAVRTSVICALNQLLDLKDLNTGVHSTRLAEWSVRIGRELGFDDGALRDLEVAAILHDIGKIGTPDHILKKPAPLTHEEREIIKKHPEYGWAVLRVVPGFERVSLFVLHHHEAFDGTGYPAGLRGDEIPIGSRIVSVMDAFDAMISSRPYRRGLALEEAVRRLEAGIGTQFDPVITPHFIAMASADAATVFDATGASLASAL